MGAILIFVLKNPAQVYSLIMTVIGLVDEGVSWLEIQQRLGAFDQAAKKAQETGDTSGMEDLFHK